jgi:hypothetical protein
MLIRENDLIRGSLGLSHLLNKVRRAVERNPSLANAIHLDPKPIGIFDERTGKTIQAYRLLVQGERLDRALRKCALGLYFHHTKRIFPGEVSIVAAFTQYSDGHAMEAVDSAVSAADAYFSQHEPIGENPEVFHYKFDSGPRSAIMLMTFYEATKVYAKFLLDEDSLKPASP